MLLGQLTGLPVAGDVGWREAPVLMQIYGVGFASVFLIFVLMYAHAYRLLSCLLAFKSPGWAGWSYFLLAPLMLLHGALSARRARRIA